MTGLHALHMVVGAGMLSWLLDHAARGRFTAEYMTPVDIGRPVLALRRHHLDFPVPLLYLIDRHMK
jgi:cytochrome c oxidase subunit III